MRWPGRGGRRAEGGPQSVDAAVRQALLAVLDRDLARAERLLSRAVRTDSEAVDAYHALARVYRQQGEIGRAIHIHQNLLLRPELRPEARRFTLAELAADFRQGGFLRRAIACYEEVLAEAPRHEPALEALSRLYRDVRNHAGALEMERRLGRLRRSDAGPAESRLWVEMAETARSEGRTQDARRALKRAIRRDRGNAAAWIALGDVEAERGRTEAALSAWRKVPELDRRSGPRVYPRLESAFAAAGRAREFEAYLRSLLAGDPDDVGARLALARTLAARGDSDESIAAVRGVLDREPENLEAHGTLGRVLLAERRDPEALKEYAELLEVLERQGLLRSRETSG